LLEEVKISKKYKQYNEDTNKKNLDAWLKNHGSKKFLIWKF
jgi:hypothetical protein